MPLMENILFHTHFVYITLTEKSQNILSIKISHIGFNATHTILAISVTGQICKPPVISFN